MNLVELIGEEGRRIEALSKLIACVITQELFRVPFLLSLLV